MPELIKDALAVASVSGYISACLVGSSLLVPPRGSKVIIHIKEKNVNAVKWKILGTVDGSIYEEVAAEQTLGKAASDYEVIDDPWLGYDVQIKDSVGGSHGSVDIHVTGL